MHRLAWAVLALGLLFGSYGAFLNDETDQASAFWNLSQGSLLVQEYPDAFYYVVADEIRTAPRFSFTDVPIGSTALNILALPVAGALVVLDQAIPLNVLFGTVAAAAVWRALGLSWPWKPESQDGASNGLIALAFAALVALATLGFRASGPTMSTFYAFPALKITNLVLFVVGGWLLWKTFERHQIPFSTRLPVFIASMIGPWLFWSNGMKYHGLAGTLVALLLFIRSWPRTARTELAVGATIGIAVWNQPAGGLVMALAVAAAELPRLWRDRKDARHVARQWACIAVGLTLGLMPAFAENLYVTGSPFTFGQFASTGATSELGHSSTANDTGSIASSWGQSLRALPSTIAHWAGLDRGWTVVKDLASIFTTGERVEGKPLGILMTTPMFLAAGAGLVALTRRDPRTPATTLAVTLLVAQALLLTEPGTHQGGGRDVRMWLPMVPPLALLAAVGLAPHLRNLEIADVKRSLAIAAVAIILAWMALAGITASGHELGSSNFEHIRTFLFASFVVFALLVGTVWSLAIIGNPVARRHSWTFTLGMAIAMTGLWTATFMLGDPQALLGSGESEGAMMFVPVMDPVVDWFYSKIVHNPPLPIVYDEFGNLVFHPDYGLCTREPNSCPTDWPKPLWIGETRVGGGTSL